MSEFAAYRDDGPLAALLARTGGIVTRVPGPVLTIAGAAPLVAVLAGAGRDVPVAQLALAAVWYVVLAGAASGTATGRLDWLMPPLLRAVEYGVLFWLTVLIDPDALPACFSLLGVLAFHHYDTVYRLRHQRVAPPAWLRFTGGGWDVRLAGVYVLVVTGWLGVGMAVAAAVLAGLFVTESVAAWLRYDAQRPALYEDEEDEGE